MGLQGMTSSNSDVRSILSVLANCIGQLTAGNIALDTQAIANILVGLRSSSSEHTEVRAVLIALSKNLRRNMNVFRDVKPRELSMALQGLQGMSSEHPQVELLLEIICDGLDIRTQGEGFNNGGFEFRSGDELGPALGCLKQMSAENPQVRRLLLHIGRAMGAGGSRIKGKDVSKNASKKGVNSGSASSGSLHMNEQNIGNSLYGLQSMDCRSEEVRGILAALAKEIMTFEGTLSGRTVANSLYGES
jgi:hypothetical protein